MPEIVKAYIADDGPALRDALRPYQGRIEIITSAQVEQQPDLLGQVEIAYGWLNEGQLARAPRLRWLQTGGAGVEGLIPHVQAGSLILTNARGVGAAPITEHMFGMLLMETRRLA